MGSLSAVRVADRTTASVTYTHDPAQGAGVDRFRYAVQAPGTGVSTAAEVIIRVVDRAPVFVSPATLDFPPVPAGRTQTKVINLRNDGGGVIAGRIELPEPWVFTDGDGEYRLGENQSAEIAVTFAPQVAGGFSGAASFSHSPNRRISLTGSAVEPVTLEPVAVELRTDGESLVRKATVTLKNRTDERHVLDINLPQELGGPREITLDPSGELNVELQTEAGFLGALDGKIEVIGDGVELSAPFRVFAAPARLVVDEVSQEVNFGSVIAGRSVRGEIKLRNVGGAEARLLAQLPPGVSMEPGAHSEPLRPGEERDFVLTFVGTEAGDFEGVLEIAEADGSRLSWELRAVVEADPRLAGGGTGVDRPVPAAVEPGGSQVTPSGVKRIEASFPPVEEIRVGRRTKSEIEVEWDNPDPSIVRYLVLERKIDFTPQGTMRVDWKALENTDLRIDGKVTRLSISGLRPGQRIALGIVGYDSDGRATAPSLPFIFDSVHAKPIHVPWLAIGMIIFVICVVVLWREKQRQKRELNAEVQKINQWR